MNLTQKATQPLCSKEDDPVTQEAGGGEIIVSMVLYDDSGTVVSREGMETTEIHSLTSGSFSVLEVFKLFLGSSEC
jgi:hypothetical protein